MSNKISPKSFIKKYSISIPKKSTRKTAKISDCVFTIPKLHEFTVLERNNYKVSQLKNICKHYKLKLSGNKNELENRIYNNLRLSKAAIIIQRPVKTYFAKLYTKLKGPNWTTPSTWVNDTDFLTFSKWKDIKCTQYFTIKSNKNQIYGFDITTLGTYIAKSNTHPLNPYTREELSLNVLSRLKKIIQLSKILDIPIHIHEKEDLSLAQQVKQRIISVFQKIDQHGHNTNHEWFDTLTIPDLIKYIRELRDIWNYRANLTSDRKREICPPIGDPFFDVRQSQFARMDILSVKKIMVGVLERLVTKGVTADAKYLGVQFVLCALTLVSPSAAEAIPWLYQAVAMH